MSFPDALIVVGSPRPGGGTSGSLAADLSKGLSRYGLRCETVNVEQAVKLIYERESTIEMLNKCRLLIFSFPTYTDAPPAIMMRLMEIIASRRADGSYTGQPDFVAIANGGFPEAAHNAVSLRICRCFAGQAGLNWLGGLSVPEGLAINGIPLEQLGRMALGVRKALALTSFALARRQPIPAQAIELMARPMIPPAVYSLLGRMGWPKKSRGQA